MKFTDQRTGLKGSRCGRVPALRTLLALCWADAQLQINPKAGGAHILDLQWAYILIDVKPQILPRTEQQPSWYGHERENFHRPGRRCRTVSRRSDPASAGMDDPAENACSGHSKSIPQSRASAVHRTSSVLGQYL